MGPTMHSSNGKCPDHVATWLSERLVEHAPISVSVLDRDLRVAFCNSNFLAVFGVPDGRHCYEVYKKHAEPCEQCSVRKTFRDGISRVTEETGADCLGHSADYVVHQSPIVDQAGQITHVVNMSYDVTEQRAFQSQYNLLFEKVPCSLAVINRDLRIVRANEYARAHFGDAVGSYCFRTYKQRTAACAQCPARQTFADSQTHSSRQVRLAPDGTYTYHLVSTAALPHDGDDDSVGHIVEMSLDVTDVHVLSEELRKESVVRHSVTESAIDALVACDEQGLVTIYNHAAETLFKLPRAAVVGRAKASRFFPRAFSQCVEDGAGKLLLDETIVEDAEDEPIPVRFSGTVLTSEGEVIGGAGFFQDLRALKELERERLHNERLATVGQTVTQLAHTMKNILTGLQGGIYAIRTAEDNEREERVSDGLERLDRSFTRMTKLVRELLLFSKEHVLEKAWCDANQVAEEVVDLFRETAKQRGIDLRFEPLEPSEQIWMDADGVHTCLSNLVANGIDACIAGQRHPCEVQVSVGHRDGRLRYQVADSGCGMDPDTLQKAFTTIFTTKGASGTGLGLMMTKKITEDHGGTVEVESTRGRGTVFAIELPLEMEPSGGPDD